MGEGKPKDTNEIYTEKDSPSEFSEIEKIKLDTAIREFLFAVYLKLRKNIEEYKIVTDRKFNPKSESLCNHYLLLKLKSGKWIHVKIYTQHMVDVGETSRKEIFVSLREKEDDNYHGATHLPLHKFCPWDSEYVATKIENIIKEKNL